MSKSWDSSLVREMLSRTEATPRLPPGGPAASSACSPMACTACPTTKPGEILQMRLQRLTGLEQDKIIGEYRDVMAQIADLLDILAKPERVTAIISEELIAIRRSLARPSWAPAARHRAQRARAGHRRPDHAHRHGGDALAHRLHQEPAAERVPRPTRAAAAANRPPPRRKTTGSTSSSSPTPTTGSCASQPRPRVLG